MQVEEFYRHLCTELRQNRSLYPYYKLTDGTYAQQMFRKAYFVQRLSYIDKHIERDKNPSIWDCGCGYGTTGLYFAMNNQPAYGTTLEYYVDEWKKRCSFWSNFGDTSLFSYNYANVFDQSVAENSFDYIILQDTLHHIEPLETALKIFHKALKKDGKLILIEENGACLVKRMLLFLQRGNKRVISVYDDVLKKEVLMGNENIRSKQTWQSVFEKNGFKLDDSSLQYIRFYPSCFYRKGDIENNIKKEQKLWKRSAFLREKAFFGINMVFGKK